MIVYTPSSPHRTMVPIGLRRFIYLTAASLMIKAPESVASCDEKSLPCTICQPTDFPKSGVTLLVKKLSCKFGSFPSHLYPMLLFQVLVRSLEEPLTALTRPVCFSSSLMV